MPKYYCDYCKSYLTHDTMSVRKSHLQGRNHIKFYCDYYEAKAKETNIWNPLSIPYEITLEKLNRYSDAKKSNGSSEDNMDIDKKRIVCITIKEMSLITVMLAMTTMMTMMR